MIKFACGSCGKKLGIADTEAGLTVKCPQCGTKLRIPGGRPSGAPAPTPKPKPPPRKPLQPEEAEAETEEIPRAPDGQEFVEVEPVDAPPPRKAPRKPRQDEEEEDEEPRPAKAKAKKRRRDEDEDEEDEEEERRPRGKAKRRRDEEEDEDEDFDDEDDYDDEKGLITPNRIRGVAAVLGAGGVVAAALLIEKFNDYEYMRYICFGIAGLMVIAGIYYLIKG